MCYMFTAIDPELLEEILEEVEKKKMQSATGTAARPNLIILLNVLNAAKIITH